MSKIKSLLKFTGTAALGAGLAYYLLNKNNLSERLEEDKSKLTKWLEEKLETGQNYLAEKD